MFLSLYNTMDRVYVPCAQHPQSSDVVLVSVIVLKGVSQLSASVVRTSSHTMGSALFPVHGVGLEHTTNPVLIPL
jgi:hypothetical protein